MAEPKTAADIIKNGTDFEYKNNSAVPRDFGASTSQYNFNEELRDVAVSMRTNTKSEVKLSGSRSDQRAVLTMADAAKQGGRKVSQAGDSAPDIIVAATEAEFKTMTFTKNKDETITLTNTENGKSLTVPANAQIALTTGKGVKQEDGWVVPEITKTESIATVTSMIAALKAVGKADIKPEAPKPAAPAVTPAIPDPKKPGIGAKDEGKTGKKAAEIVNNGSDFQYGSNPMGLTVGATTSQVAAGVTRSEAYFNIAKSTAKTFSISSEGSARAMISLNDAARPKGRTIETSGSFPPDVIVVAKEADLENAKITVNKDKTFTITTKSGNSVTLPENTQLALTNGKAIVINDDNGARSTLPVITKVETLNVVASKLAASQVAPIPDMPKPGEQKEGKGAPPMPAATPMRR